MTLIVLLVFLLLIAALAPARILINYTENLPVQFSYPTGTVWSGSAIADVDSIPLGKIDWSVSPFSLLLGQVSASSQLKGKQLDLTAVSEMTTEHQTHLIEGEIALEILNSLLVQYEIKLSGNLELEDVHLQVDESQSLTSLTGMVYWHGGEARFRLLNTLNNLELKPVQGVLSSNANQAILFVRDSAFNRQLFEAKLETDTGWFHLTLFPPFLEYMGAPPIKILNDSAFLFQFSEKIY